MVASIVKNVKTDSYLRLAVVFIAVGSGRYQGRIRKQDRMKGSLVV